MEGEHSAEAKTCPKRRRVLFLVLVGGLVLLCLGFALL